MNKFFKKTIFLFFVILTLVTPVLFAQSLFKPAYSSYKIENGKSGGKLVLGVSNDPKSFNPIVAQENTTSEITRFIFDGLVDIDPVNLDVRPHLAKSWVTEDGREWIFNLRRDVYFNDGVLFTADDVVFSFNDLIYNPKIPTGYRDIFTIEGKKIKVEKIDQFTVKFTLPVSFSFFLRSLAMKVILPKHKYASLAQEDKFTFSMGLDTKPADIVGTGPFRLKEYFPGERIELESNPFYWKKDKLGNSLPYLEGIVFAVVGNTDTILLKFMEGELDYYELRPQDLSVLGPRQKDTDFSIYNTGPSFSSQFIVFNQNPAFNSYKREWFKNPRFRQAFSYAINREKIVDLVLNGLGVSAYSSVSSGNKLFYNDKIKKYPYNPEKAKQLLKEMGFVDKDNDGVLEDKQGHNLEITLLTNSEAVLRVNLATLIKKDWQDIGVKVNFVALDFHNIGNKLSVTFDWEAVLFGFTGIVDPHQGKNVWSYKGGLHIWNMSGKAQSSYEEEIEDIFNQAAKTLDEGKRRELYAKWQEIVAIEQPLVYLTVPYTIFALRSKFGNCYPTVYGGVFSEIEYVYLH